MAISTDSGMIEGGEEPKLFYRWSSPEDPKGAVLITHGLAEHGGRYAHVVAALNDAGYAALAFDLRGHGKSEGRRVFVRRFSKYVDDVERARGLLREKYPEGPLFLLGHSMGGVIVLLYAATHPGVLDGLIASSPGLRAKVHVPLWKDALGRLMSLVWPTLAIPTGLPASDISHDPEVVRAYEADPLVTNKATARWYTEYLAAQDVALRGAASLTLPTLVIGPEGDRVVDPACYHQLLAALGAKDKTLKSYPGFFHEAFNEVERDRVIGDLVAWLQGHTG